MNLIYGLIALWLIMRLIKKIPRKITLDVLANEVATNGRDEFFKKWKNKTFTIIGPVIVDPNYYIDGVKGVYPLEGLEGVFWRKIYGERVHYREIVYSKRKKICALSAFLLDPLSSDYYASLGFNKELINEINSSHILQKFEIICVFSSFSSDLDKITDDCVAVKVKGTLSAIQYYPNWNNALRSNSLILTNCRILAVYDENGNKKR